MATLSVSRGINFYYNDVSDDSYPTQTQPIGVDPKWRSVWFGTTIGTVGGGAGDKLQALRLGDILIFDDDLSPPVYAADRTKAHQTLVN